MLTNCPTARGLQGKGESHVTSQAILQPPVTSRYAQDLSVEGGGGEDREVRNSLAITTRDIKGLFDASGTKLVGSLK